MSWDCIDSYIFDIEKKCMDPRIRCDKCQHKINIIKKYMHLIILEGLKKSNSFFIQDHTFE